MKALGSTHAAPSIRAVSYTWLGRLIFTNFEPHAVASRNENTIKNARKGRNGSVP